MATTEQILSSQAVKDINPRWKKYFDRLVRMRERLAAQCSTQRENAKADESTAGVNPADRGSDEYDVEAALSLISSDQNAIYEIDQALQRIREGTFGTCEATGKPIPEDRLEAIPWTRFARDVEEKLEREEQARKVKHAL